MYDQNELHLFYLDVHLMLKALIVGITDETDKSVGHLIGTTAKKGILNHFILIFISNNRASEHQLLEFIATQVQTGHYVV